MQYHYVENVHSYNDNNAWHGQWPSNNTQISYAMRSQYLQSSNKKLFYLINE